MSVMDVVWGSGVIKASTVVMTVAGLPKVEMGSRIKESNGTKAGAEGRRRMKMLGVAVGSGVSQAATAATVAKAEGEVK